MAAHPAPDAHFTPETMRFLRGLIKHNDREWFEARRPVYERAVRDPMLRFVEDVNRGIGGFAGEHVRPAHKTVMRIYRDTRFSPDKRPYKRHMAAWWARRGMEKTSGGGFYVQIGPAGVVVAAGVYLPEKAQMLAVRRWLAEHHAEYLKLVAKAAKTPKAGQPDAASPAFAALEPEALTRMPKGFAPELADTLAGALVRAKNWGVSATLPTEAALAAGFAEQVVGLFRRAAPVVDALNGAMLGSDDPPARKPLF